MSQLHQVSNTYMVRIRTPSYYTQAEIEAILQQLAEQAKPFLPAGTVTRYMINYVQNKGTYVGYCFAVLEPVGFFHLVLGNNADGSLRERAEIQDYGPPPLPSGLVWPLDQAELPPALAEAMANWRGDWESDEVNIKYVREQPLLEIPFGVTFEAAMLADNYFAEDVSGFILTIKDAPLWLGEDQLRPIFGYYSHAGPEYPKIWTLPPRAGATGRTIFLAYRPGSYDALFALTMLRRFKVVKDGRVHEFTVGQANSRVTVPNKDRGGHGGGSGNRDSRQGGNHHSNGGQTGKAKAKPADDGWSTAVKKR